MRNRSRHVRWFVSFALLTGLIAIPPPPAAAAADPISFEARVATGDDDAEESVQTGQVSRSSSDLELVSDSSGEQIIGIRFVGVDVPPGALIGQAYVQFKADETSFEATSLTIEAQAAADPPGFAGSDYDISTRPRTTTSAVWNPPSWGLVGEEGPDQRTSDLSAVIQELIDRPGWSSGNSMVLLITGSGSRVAESFNGDAAGAPLLHIDYLPSGGTDQPPTASFQASCDGLSCSFQDLSTDDLGVTQWLWDFGDGTTSTEQSPDHDYGSEGTYTVTLDVFDASGGSDTHSSDVSVTAENEPPPGPSGTPGVYPFGPHLDSMTDLGPTFTGAEITMSPDTIIAELNAARNAGVSIVIDLVGSQSNYQNPNGTFNLDLWKGRVDRFSGLDFTPWIDDGTIVGHYLVSEAKAPDQYGGSVITNDVIDAMAAYSKQLWPNLLTVIRTQPTKLKEHAAGHNQPWPGWEWTHLDTAWARYSTRRGPVAQYISDEVDEARIQGLGLLFGMNVLNGGDGSSGVAGYEPGTWSMSPDEVLDYGSQLINEPFGCAVLMWRYDLDGYVYFERPDISAVMNSLSAIAVARGPSTCLYPESTPQLVEIRVGASSDDAEEGSGGGVNLGSSDLEMVVAGNGEQVVGMRFGSVDIPAGATILEAHLEFRVDEVGTEYTGLTIRGEADDNPATFTTTNADVSSRPLTVASALWEPPPWDTVGESGPDQHSADISAVIQEIVDRQGWVAGNAIAIVIQGTGQRTADSYDGSADNAPLLHVEYRAGPVSNDPPIANDDTATTSEDTPVTTDAIANDIDGNLDPTTVTITTPPTDGDATADGAGSVTFTPDPDFNGTDTYIYEVCDTGGLCDTATVTITVTPVNDSPVATDDPASTSEDVAVNVDVLANDSDIDSATLTTTNLTQPGEGSAVVEADGTITYIPNLDFNGTDTFTYTANDGVADSAPATVTVTVDPVPDPPVANDDTASTSEDTPVDIDVAANDTDVDGDLDATTVSVITSPSQGSATPVGDGTITYSPDPGTTGSDSFVYQVCDTTASCDTATVAVAIGPVNDPPIANDDSTSVSEDASVLFDPVANDSDPEGSLERASTNTDCTGCSTPSDGSLTDHGDGTFTYTPDPDFNGTDTYIYEVCDTEGLCDTATVTITVTPVPDAPVANDDTASTTEDTPVNLDVLANDTDPDADIAASTLQVTGGPASGSAVIQPDDTITYTPDPGTSGTDSFNYQICDTTALCDTATVIIDIGAVNDPVTAIDDDETTAEDIPVTTDVLANDTDPDANLDPSTLQVTTPPPNGSTTIEPDDTITYTPDPDFNGTDSYIYEVCDTGGLCDTATVTITVTPVPDAPVANDDTASTTEDTPVDIDVAANDTDVDGDLDLTTAIVTTPPSQGTSTAANDGTITYTPDPGASGADSFTYQICDTAALCDTAVVTITISSSQTVVEQYAISEATILGNVSGSLSDTQTADGVYEEVTEVHSGGPPPNRQSFLEHHWMFSIQRGDSIEVSVQAYHSPNGESDDVAFEFSVDGGATFQPLFTITDTGSPTLYTAPLPTVISGEVVIRAVDTDQTPGNGTTDTLFVDHLVIRTTNPAAPLPTVTVTAVDDSAAESGDTGSFVVHRDLTAGPLVVGFTLGGTADEVDDYSPLGASVTFADGQSNVTLVVDPVDDGVAEGDESVELSLDAGTDYQRGASLLATVFILDNNVAGSEARAISENTVSGSVISGDYTSTHFADGDTETIEEELYAGNKRSRLEHTWTFAVAPGGTVTFHLLASHAGAEGFTFAYSLDGGSSWTDLDVSATGNPDSVGVSDQVQGSVLVRVTDDDRSNREPTIDVISIEEMYFLSSP